MKNKIFSVMAILVLVMSIMPVAFAQGSDDNVTSGQDDDDDESDDSDSTDDDDGADDDAIVLNRDERLRDREAGKERLQEPQERFKEEQQAVQERLREQRENGNWSNGTALQRLTALKEARRERLENIDARFADRVQKLDEEHMRKIMELKEERLEKIAQLDQKQLEKLAALDRARFERLANKSVDDIEKELSHIRIEKVKKEDAFRKREVSEKRIKEADDIYRESLKLYDEDLEALKEQRKAWKSAVKEGDEEDAIKHAKEYLTSAADLVIDSLEKVRARVVANDDLTEADAKAILAEIDERVAAMEDAKETVADAKTKEEVKAAGKEVMAAWEHSRLKLKIHAEKVAAASVGEIISRSEQLEKRLDIILAEMESNGTVVDDLDEKVDDFSDLVDDARAKYAQAQEYLEQAKAEEDSTLFEKAKTLVRDAHDDLKEANVILMEIVREVKQEGGSLEDDEDDDSVDVIVEDDDDDGSEDESDDEGNTTQA